MLRGAARAFPDRGIDRSKVRGAFAGLRPILDTDAADPSKASRDEGIWEERGTLSVAGGKLTTWRTTAETAVDAALKLLPGERAGQTAPCATTGAILAGLAPRGLARELEAQGLDAEVAGGMARRLGSRAWHALGSTAPDDLSPLADGLDLSAAEVRSHLAGGAVLHLEDLLLRRVRLGMWDPGTALGILPRLRPVACDAMAWDNRRWDTEEETFRLALEAWAMT